MPLRTKLLLALLGFALIPMILFGLTAYLITTTNLNALERVDLEKSIDSANRALSNIQGTLVNTTVDNSTWNDLHDQVANGGTDAGWFRDNFGADASGSVTAIHNLSLVGILDKSKKPLFQGGPTGVALPLLDNLVQQALDSESVQTTLASVNNDVYIVAISPIRTTDQTDTNGVLLLGHKLGDDDVQNIKQLTGYDVAIYERQDLIAQTTPSGWVSNTGVLDTAASGSQSFDVSHSDMAYAYQPLIGQGGATVAILVIQQPRVAIIAAQNSISETLALSFVLSALAATFVAVVLRNSIRRPLVKMADTADQITNGDLSQRVPVMASHDEVERLAVAFNQMAQRVGERVEELKAFAHTVAHDLKQPLHVLMGYADMLNESRTENADATETVIYCADQITKISWKMNAIIRELLLLAEIRDVEVAHEPLDMAAIVIEAQKRVAPTMAELHAEITLPRSWPTALGYAPWIEEVWANYMSNALKYGGKPPRMELGASTDPDGQVRFWIRDNGAGLTPEQQGKLFTPFTRLNQAQIQGHGLGLSIVRRIVEKLGGRVGVESTVGQGSTFYFTLKAPQDVQQPAEKPELAVV